MEVRLQKFLAEAGIASRRKAEELILAGRIKVNGVTVTELGTKVDDVKDEVFYDGKPVKKSEKLVYIMLNKPEGFVTTVKDQFNRPTVMDLIKGVKERVVPVGRLDYDTSGLLILTNDGELTFKLTHPSKKVEKTYIALVRGIVKANEATIDMPIARSTSDRKKMAVSEKGKKAVTHFKVLKRYSKYNCSLLEVKIETGRTHQIRVHLAQIGYPIIGDSVYSKGSNIWGIEGQCLHAISLKFHHPVTGKEMFIEAPLPEYFDNLIKELDGSLE